jgi:uncharacterized protein YndB with AHSA1/START domain
MTEVAAPDSYGTLIEPATLKIERLLPGPIERVWAYLTQSDLRRQWLASGEMKPEVGSSFELTWRNDQLNNAPDAFSDDTPGHHVQTSEMVAFEPPHRLAYHWHGVGDVEFTLAEEGGQVRLTLTHSRIPDQGTLMGVSTGWHAHLDFLAARLTNTKMAPYEEVRARVKAEYERRLSA